MPQHPNIIWAETDNSLYVTLLVTDVPNPEVKIEEQEIHFKGKNANNTFDCVLKLNGKVDPKHEDTKWSSTDRVTEIHLMKAEEGRFGRLLEDKRLNKSFVKCDWDKWVDSDDEEEEKKDFDMSQFAGQGGMPGMGGGGMPGMPGMGGMGGMPGMGGMGGMPGMGGAGGMGGMDLAEMMKSMGGGMAGGGMPGMPGGDAGDLGDDDDDEDDLPDLEDDDGVPQQLD